MGFVVEGNGREERENEDVARCYVEIDSQGQCCIVDTLFLFPIFFLNLMLGGISRQSLCYLLASYFFRAVIC
jgi:hypothetical protein